jgi:hypothetical protein
MYLKNVTNFRLNILSIGYVYILVQNEFNACIILIMYTRPKQILKKSVPPWVPFIDNIFLYNFNNI